MELVSRLIPCSTRQSDEILILPVGDIQWSGRDDEVALGMLKRHIEWGVQQGAYFIGMGDYIDFMSPSNRARFSAAALYDTTVKSVDDKAMSLVEDLYYRALKPSKGRWLGLLEGHHYHQLATGVTTDQKLAEMLEAPFLGNCSIVRLVVRRGQSARGSVQIWAHHGVGGGSTIGVPLNQLERLVTNWPECDIFLVGHHHKKVTGPLDATVARFDGPGGARLIHKTKILACTGGFLKGYVVGSRQGKVPRGNYIEQKMLRPVALGGVLVKIRPQWGSDGFKADMSVEA